MSCAGSSLVKLMPFGTPPDFLADAVAVLVIEFEPEGNAARAPGGSEFTRDMINSHNYLIGGSCFGPSSRPLPGRFTEQQLVDLLKLPTCCQPARHVIVRQLGW